MKLHTMAKGVLGYGTQAVPLDEPPQLLGTQIVAEMGPSNRRIMPENEPC